MDNLLKQAVQKKAKAEGLLMKQVAAEFGISESALSNKLAGARTLTFEEAHRVAIFLDTTLDVVWLLAS